MRKLIVMSVLLASSFMYKAADAQVKVSLNINVGSQPEWGPSGYEHVDYYYLPDLDMYYNVPNRTYTYLQGNRWVTVSNLPRQYRNYDFYKGYKVVVNEPNPWNRHVNYKTRCASYRGNSNQVNWRDYNRGRNVEVKKVKYKKTNGKDKYQRYEAVETVRTFPTDRNPRDERRGNDRSTRNGRG